MMYFGGVFIAFLCILAAMVHLEQNAEMLWDFVAFAVVMGGTVSVALITFPWKDWLVMKRLGFALFVSPSGRRKEYIQESIKFVQSATSGQIFRSETGRGLPNQVLKDGEELLNLGFDRQVIEEVLAERVYQYVQRGKRVANKIRSLSKYPPAFGLAGTVLGLVHLMGGISKGMSPQETGVLMAIALMATFYGLIVANVIVNPLGERVLEIVEQEEKLAEIGVRAVVLVASHSHLLEAQEVLNSYAEPGERVNNLEMYSAFDEGAA